jgi:hypothetical protein
VIGEACGEYITGRNEEKLIFLWASPNTGCIHFATNVGCPLRMSLSLGYKLVFAPENRPISLFLGVKLAIFIIISDTYLGPTPINNPKT